MTVSNNDHCRIGSLEKAAEILRKFPQDHCRIGSLESFSRETSVNNDDHCRIGSLENTMQPVCFSLLDHCRIGSLEIRSSICTTKTGGSLPHRQLRKHCMVIN